MAGGERLGWLVAFVAVAAVALLGCSGSADGSLLSHTGGNFTQGILSPVGNAITFAGVPVGNPTHHAVTVTDIRMITIDTGLRYDGWRLDDTTIDQDTLANSESFPPTAPGVQPGPVVPPSIHNSAGHLVANMVVALGFTALRPGRYDASGIVVTYRNAAGMHRATLCTQCRVEIRTSTSIPYSF
jgi:hypothetical protein